MDYRCKPCFEKTFNSYLIKYQFSESEKIKFSGFFKKLMRENIHKASPVIQMELQKKLCEIIDLHDPYKPEKEESNRIALQLYEEWKPKVEQSENPFDLALRLAIAGNIMDYGANSSFNIRETIEKVLKSSLAIDDSQLLFQRINDAKNILYLADNAGEIVFDKLFLETIMHPGATYVVKGGPALNDATTEDAYFVEMDTVADVISNGFDAPSTILKESSEEFLALFKSADLIISKGQGNFEGLMQENDSRIFFILMAKCDLIADLLNVEKGSFVIANLN